MEKDNKLYMSERTREQWRHQCRLESAVLFNEVDLTLSHVFYRMLKTVHEKPD
jgi:hypothetical protein